MNKRLLITLDFPPSLGGVANYLSCLSLNNYVVLAPKIEGARDFDQKQNYRIYRERMLSKYLWPKWFFLFFKVLRIIWKEKIEMIQISHLLPIGYIALIIKKIFKIPYLIYVHGMDLGLVKKNKRKFFFAEIILRNAEIIIANSHFTEKMVFEFGIEKNKVKVVYPRPHITPEKFKIDFKKRGGIIKKYHLENKKVLLSIGRLVRRKGFDLVIQSFPKVIEEIPNLVYFVVGEGAEKENLINLVQSLSLENKVFFIGAASDEELALFYSLCHLFIMTPREIKGDVEGFGIVYLEAASFGKPSLSSRSGGAGEAVLDNETGLLVEPENINEISQNIIKLLLNQELMDRLGKRAKKRVN